MPRRHHLRHEQIPHCRSQPQNRGPHRFCRNEDCGFNGWFRSYAKVSTSSSPLPKCLELQTQCTKNCYNCGTNLWLSRQTSGQTFNIDKFALRHTLVLSRGGFQQNAYPDRHRQDVQNASLPEVYTIESVFNFGIGMGKSPMISLRPLWILSCANDAAYLISDSGSLDPCSIQLVLLTFKSLC